MKRSQSFMTHGEAYQTYCLDIIEKLILATEVNSYFEPADDDEGMQIAKLIIRCADLCHVTKDMDYHLLNVHCLNNELGITLSAKANAGFIEKFALPLFIKLDEYCKTQKSAQWIQTIKAKIDYWQSKDNSFV